MSHLGGQYTLVKKKNRSKCIYRGSQNALPIIRALAKKLRALPKAQLRLLYSLYKHENKKQVTLQHLGGAEGGGRGFVIGNNTVVSGLTHRMSYAQTIFDPNDIVVKNENISTDLYSLFSKLVLNDKIAKNFTQSKKVNASEHFRKCSLQTRSSPMAHGSKVHHEIYTSISYILRLAGFNLDGRSTPTFYKADICTLNALNWFLHNDIIPFTSEWPAFIRTPPGVATAVDVLAIDISDDYRITVVEVKTSNLKWALKTPSAGEDQWPGVITNMWQVIMSAVLCKLCYPQIFNWYDLKMKIIYVRPWAVMSVNVPEALRTPAMCQMWEDLTIRPFSSMFTYVHSDTIKRPKYKNIIIEELKKNKLDPRINFNDPDQMRKRCSSLDKCLRSKLNSSRNTQSHLTTSGTVRKRAPKKYTAGFTTN